MVENEKVEEKTYTVSFTEQEIKERIVDLQQDANVDLFLKIQDGQKKFDELIKLSKLLEKKD